MTRPFLCMKNKKERKRKERKKDRYKERKKERQIQNERKEERERERNIYTCMHAYNKTTICQKDGPIDNDRYV